MGRRRYKAVFTPVGWQVVDTKEARDPVAEFGSGAVGYQQARNAAERLNKSASGPTSDTPQNQAEQDTPDAV